MRWAEIRSHYPGQWLLVEAVKAHAKESRRILDELAVINVFSNSTEAMQSYAKLHHQNPGREFYVLHTDREKFDIAERKWIGIRSAQ
jgi:hypothetical protein